MSRGTLQYIGQRLVLILFTALVVSSVVFLALHSVFKNDAFFSERLRDPSLMQARLHHYYLDLPLGQQYVIWLTNTILHGNLGESIANRGVYITPLLIKETGTSVTVGGVALIFTVGVGMLLGLFAALRQNTWVDYTFTTIAVLGYSIPNFVIATFMVLVFSVWLNKITNGTVFYEPGWGTPGSSYIPPEQIIVPAIALGMAYAGNVARLTRASMLEVIRQDYVRTAWAKGLPDRVVILRHALRNALIPVVTILGPLVTGIITGSVVIESIFGIPGLGKEFVVSILNRDFNIVIGVFTFYAALVGLANLLVDVIYPLLDPRIRY